MKKALSFITLILVSMQSFAGGFLLYARDPFGAPFTNSSSVTQTYQFFPSGIWEWAGNNAVGPQGGAPCKQFGDTCPIADGGVGEVIVRVGGGFYPVGNFAQVDIAPQQTIYFLFNDSGTNFDKHTGQLTVNWVCIRGC